MKENPNQIHGRINEALHIAGYSIERAVEKFEWLLDDGRWMQVGDGYESIEQFLPSITMPKGIAPTDRKRLAKKIKALQPDTSQRKIAGSLNVGEATIGRDLGTRKATASYDAPEELEPAPDKEPEPEPASYDAPTEPTGEEVAALARERKRRQEKDQERERKREENRKLVSDAPPPSSITEGQAFQAIVLDPPWDWGDEGDVSQFGRGDPTYGTMSFEDVADLPVPDLADNNTHLYLWITNRSLPKGFGLLERWGFRYVTMLTWVKPSIGMGNYFRGSTEHVLFGIKGSLPLLRRDLGTHFQAERPGKHSAKPEEFYKIVESSSPGPWLEMFAREERSGWVVWGAEVPADE